MKIPEWLKLPENRSIKDLDEPAATLLHARIIAEKPFLKKLYLDFYRRFEKAVDTPKNKVLVELGSGAGFIKDVIPGVITSDILELPNVDRVFSAIDMPLENDSVDAFFMFDVLHHIPDAKKFFTESLRSLKKGGKIVMIEPANTPWSRFIYKNFHHEAFDQKAQWTLKKAAPLSCANSALAWIIFLRDRRIFEKMFPSLKIVRLENHTPLRYIISGGFTLRQMLPSHTCRLIETLENILSPFNDLLGMFMTVELEKIN